MRVLRKNGGRLRRFNVDIVLYRIRAGVVLVAELLAFHVPGASAGSESGARGVQLLDEVENFLRVRPDGILVAHPAFCDGGVGKLGPVTRIQTAFDAASVGLRVALPEGVYRADRQFLTQVDLQPLWKGSAGSTPARFGIAIKGVLRGVGAFAAGGAQTDGFRRRTREDSLLNLAMRETKAPETVHR